MRAAIYCRVSTKEQAKNLSLSTQEKSCRDYCDRSGISVSKTFVDEGESAKTSNRPEFKSLLEYCRRNKEVLEYLIVYKIDRFARNQYEHLAIRTLLKKYGISLRSATEPIDDTSTGRLMEGVLSSFAQFDNDVRSERTTAGMKASLEQGKWTFQPPLGYRKPVTPEPHPSLEEDPISGSLIRGAFELVATGRYSETEVLDRVNTLGLRTKRGKEVSKQTFSKMVRNPLYSGRVVVPKWEIETQGDFEPLVAPELFQQVQSILNGKATPVSESRKCDHPDFPLRRIVRCAYCDTPLTGSRSKGRSAYYSYYHCRNSECRKVRIASADLHTIFRATLANLTPKQGLLMLFQEVVLDSWRKKQLDTKSEKSELERRLVELRLRRSQLVEAFVYKKQLIQDIYEEESGKLEQQIAMTQIDIHDLELEDLDVEGILRFADHILKQPLRIWEESSLKQKIRFQRVVFPEGLEFDGSAFRTAATSSIFSYLQEIGQQEEDMVSPRGTGRWKTPIDRWFAVDGTRRAA